MKTLAQRLAEERAAKGWTQGKLAAAAGLSQSAIGNIEAGTRQSKGSLPQIAEALGVNYKWLLTGEGPKRDQSEAVQPTRAAEPTPRAYVSPSTALQMLAQALVHEDLATRNAALELIAGAIREPNRAEVLGRKLDALTIDVGNHRSASA